MGDFALTLVLVEDALDLDGEVLVLQLCEHEGGELLVLERELDRDAAENTHELRCEEQDEGVHVAYHDAAGDEHDLQRRREGILEPARQARSFEILDAHDLAQEVDLEKTREKKDEEEHPVPVGVRQAEEAVRLRHPRLHDIVDIDI